MNGLAFWIQDNFLKKSEDGETTQRIKEPLIWELIIFTI